MPSLKDIKNRIKGISSTKKITQAMKIVSASRLKQSQNNIGKTQHYLKALNDLLIDLYNLDHSLFFSSHSPYLRKGEGKNVLLVIFSSDKGLCGSFNSKITSAVANIIEHNKSQGKNIRLICVGNKISQYINAHYKDLMEFSMPFANLENKNISYNHSASLGQKIRDLFMSGVVDECRVLYTKYHTVMKQEITNVQLLPFGIECIEGLSNKEQAGKTVFEVDNKLSNVLESIIVNLINAIIFNVYANSITCEYSARMIAMDGATQNSIKVLKELNLLYNRSRQALITKELMEIISGAEAIN
ncbi:ATP synthase F1 subunit gamma [Candidatus Bandiella euplotis]|uniref:ATP synthase gamma chain n=1 Tax=Candidatus Bandiella euplotis TaxID=1664265 RepID=A0ABZ0UMF5_9RICK|nr:ATP synthase F1 subunit gamma [Candidatus Bandiella woodruffii]WPX96243.1 ATP synthase subunit gamma [Candidatus Bandiella woodruffii]